MKIVIIGCGAAGVSAAKRLREASPSAQVVLFDMEGRGLYAKIRLPEYLAGKLPKEKLVLSGLEAMRKMGIDVRAGESVSAIHPETRTVSASGGGAVEYDKLIIATGAKAFKPVPPGCSPELILTLRTLEDAERIAALAKPSKEAIIIGGGLLGLEAAWALGERGMKAHVVECLPRLLPKQLDEMEARLLQEKMGGMGFAFHLGRAAACVRPENGRLGLRLDDGEELEADLILASAGIAPETSLARAAGIAVKRAILVNERLETSVEGIYAAGDCAEINGRVIGLWAAAKDQGEGAADIILGVKASFSSPEYDPTLKVSGVQLKEIRREAAIMKERGSQ